MPEITTTVESSDATVKAVRQEIPVGVGGEAIQRIPYASSLEKLLETGVTSRVIASTTRCIRIVELPVKGGGTAKFHCSRACVGVAGQQLCPDHDRSSFVPVQNSAGPKPPVTNSASIQLTQAELDEMGVKESQVSATVAGPASSIPRSAPKPPPKPKAPRVARKAASPAGETIAIVLTLEELESPDMNVFLIDKITQALDELPATTIAHMKKIVALQERIARLWRSQ